MEVQGKVQGGMVVFSSPPPFSEGETVVVRPSVSSDVTTPKKRGRIVFPIVPPESRGPFQLTNDDIQRMLENDDRDSYQRSFGQS